MIRQRIPYNHIIERREIVLSTREIHTPEHQYDYCTRGIANVRIGGDWDTLGVDIGNQQCDKIHRISGTYVFDMFEHGCIPFLKFHSIQFLYTGRLGVLSYDIVSLSAPEAFEFVYKSQQFTGEVDTYTRVNDVSLSFNNPVEKLVVHCKYPVTDIEFFYDKYDTDRCCPLVKKTDTWWELTFHKTSVNFSELDWPILQVWTPTENTIYVFATGFQTAQSRHGMMRIV